MKFLKAIKNLFIPVESWVVIDTQKCLGGWLNALPNGNPDGHKGNKREVIVTRKLRNTYTDLIKFETVIEWTDNVAYMAAVNAIHKEKLAKILGLEDC
jgi:hypothetical protein